MRIILALILLFLICTSFAEHFTMKKPFGQLTSMVPISKQCLLNINKQEYKGPINISIKHKFHRERNRCNNLKLEECLRTPTCGWLTDSAKKNGRCYEGTPIGPINPLDVPNAEDSDRRNLTIDRWHYYRPHLV